MCSIERFESVRAIEREREIEAVNCVIRHLLYPAVNAIKVDDDSSMSVD